jgi:hypothetical protein
VNCAHDVNCLPDDRRCSSSDAPTTKADPSRRLLTCAHQPEIRKKGEE